MGRVALVLMAVALAVGSFSKSPAQEARAIAVEPADLAKRADLVGREVVVDDRVSRFQFHQDKGFDQIYLRRAPDVAFELPERLRPKNAPRSPGVTVRGTLQRDGDRVYVDVISFESLPSDLDRLNRALAVVPRGDVDRRMAWSRWGAKRAREFDDAPLAKKAKEVERETIVVEAERPAGHDPLAHWVALAARARENGLAEPEPSALAHRGFRAGLAAAKTAAEYEALAAKVEGFFPESSGPVEHAPDLGRFEKPYAADPWATYRSLAPNVRAAFDRRLWADAVGKSVALRADGDRSSTNLIALSEEASKRLPDRPEFGVALLEKGLEAGVHDVGSLRLREVDALAGLYRDRLHQPDGATKLYRLWLDNQRQNRLTPRDAEGRIALAGQYERLVDDRATAVALLRESWAIDPSTKEVNEAFLRRDYRKVKGEWVDGKRARPAAEIPPATSQEVATADEPEAAPVALAARGDSLRHATRAEVRARLGGKPNQVAFSATQGRLVEQWVYFGPRQNQYINFARKAGDTQARVVAYYSLPRSAADAAGGP